jgi:uncharacterized membrane protein YjgN (DUF898 family)
MAFRGNAREYFSIWSVNMALTLVTFGIYSAWAKVRTRNYFYSNTVLDGRPFHYLGEPKAILVGHLIVAGPFLLGNTLGSVLPALGWVAGAASLLLGVLMPYLIRQAYRFRARNSAFRGIRFRFHGTAGESYKIYFMIPSAVFTVIGLFLLLGAAVLGGVGSPGALGLLPLLPFLLIAAAYPWWVYRQKRYLYDNLAFGATTGRFSPDLGVFYKTYAAAAGISALVFVWILLIVAFANPFVGGESSPGATAIVASLVMAVLAVTGSMLFKEFVYARLARHVWENFTLGGLRFRAEYKAWDLLALQLTNLLAIVGTLGFLYPWAKVRKTRYLTENFIVVMPGEVEEFIAASDAQVSALGDAAADFFDWDMGW